MDSPSDVLPTPGGPTRARITPLRSSSMSRSRRNLRTARYSRMRSLTSFRPAWSASRISRAACTSWLLVGDDAPRHGEQPVEVGADRGALGPLRRRPRARPSSRSASLRASSGSRSRRCGRGSARPRRRPRRLAELLADRVELAAQQELALALLHALGDVVADAALQLDLAEHLARPAGRLLEAPLDVERLEQLELLRRSERSGREAGGVGQRARLLDGAQERGDAARAASLEDRLEDGAVRAHLLCEFVGRCRSGSGRSATSMRSAPPGGVRTPELGAVERAQRDPAVAAGQDGRARRRSRRRRRCARTGLDLAARARPGRCSAR